MLPKKWNYNDNGRNSSGYLHSFITAMWLYNISVSCMVYYNDEAGQPWHLLQRWITCIPISQWSIVYHRMLRPIGKELREGWTKNYLRNICQSLHHTNTCTYVVTLSYCNTNTDHHVDEAEIPDGSIHPFTQTLLVFVQSNLEHLITTLVE